MTNYPYVQLTALLKNIETGIRLSFFNRAAFQRFTIGFDHAVYIILFGFLWAIACDYLKYLPDPQFNSYAVTDFSLQVLGLLLTAFVLAKLLGEDHVALAFVIAISSIGPFFGVVFLLITVFGENEYLSYGYSFWVIADVVFITAFYLQRQAMKVIVTIAVYLIFVISPAIYLPLENFWYAKEKVDNYYTLAKSVAQEQAYYDQFDYLKSIDSALLPGRPSVTDLYFVGFASYARENVFMKEIDYITHLMDRDFDTQGRSIALINNLQTLHSTPLATVSNLVHVLNSIGKAMNIEEDILFLYLTSHGSRTPELSVSFWPLQLIQVTPDNLAQALDDAKIKWRVILVSACYSGGFMQRLINDNTLIMTAAAKDRTSFGCGTKSDFTYFGQAVFVDQLAKNKSFLESFENARGLIESREKAEKLTPSLPQLHIGNNIRHRIEALQAELDLHYNR